MFESLYRFTSVWRYHNYNLLLDRYWCSLKKSKFYHNGLSDSFMTILEFFFPTKTRYRIQIWFDLKETYRFPKIFFTNCGLPTLKDLGTKYSAGISQQMLDSSINLSSWITFCLLPVFQGKLVVILFLHQMTSELTFT